MMVKEAKKCVKELATPTVRLCLLPNGIVHYTYLPNSEVDEAAHQANHDALVELVGITTKVPVLIDASEFVTLTPEARKLARNLESIVPISKRAFVIKSLGQRMLASFYITFHQPIVPTKIFTTYREAELWLLDRF